MFYQPLLSVVLLSFRVMADECRSGAVPTKEGLGKRSYWKRCRSLGGRHAESQREKEPPSLWAGVKLVAKAVESRLRTKLAPPYHRIEAKIMSQRVTVALGDL